MQMYVYLGYIDPIDLCKIYVFLYICIHFVYLTVLGFFWLEKTSDFSRSNFSQMTSCHRRTTAAFAVVCICVLISHLKTYPPSQKHQCVWLYLAPLRLKRLLRVTTFVFIVANY